jgi:hypothetical protein
MSARCHGWLSGSTAFVLLVGCGGGSAQSELAAIGREGAKVSDENSQPSTADKEGPQMTGPCATPPAAGQEALIDDFEDGDNQAFKTYKREGWWYASSDGTEKSPMHPPKSAFTADLLDPSEAIQENQMAGHFIAPKTTDWGVIWGSTMHWVQDGLKCPFNASGFDGLRFRAKGPATITVKIGTVATVPPEFGGICENKCWDQHNMVVRIGEDWGTFYLPWNRLQQGGWGTDARFEAERVIALNWTASLSQLPADFWVDDVAFYRESERTASVQGDHVQIPTEEVAKSDVKRAASDEAMTDAVKSSTPSQAVAK